MGAIFTEQVLADRFFGTPFLWARKTVSEGMALVKAFSRNAPSWCESGKLCMERAKGQ